MFVFGVRLKKGSDPKTEEKNRQAMVGEYLKKGKIGAYRPMDLRDAQSYARRIAIAVRKRHVIRGGSNATPGRLENRSTAPHSKIKGKIFQD